MSLQQIFTRLVAVIVVSAVHGFTVAQVATWLGDPEPSHQGRRSISPFSHIDLVGGAGLLLFGLGWIRPIQIDKSRLRSGGAGLLAVTATGFVAVLLVSALAFISRQFVITALPGGVGITTVAALDASARIGIWFVLFNIIPIPPLTGRLIGYALMPEKTGHRIERYAPHASVALGLLIVTGLASDLLASPMRSITSSILGWLG